MPLHRLALSLIPHLLCLHSLKLSDILADLIIDSCSPPKCGASGGVKCQTIPLFDVDALILSYLIAGATL